MIDAIKYDSYLILTIENDIKETVEWHRSLHHDENLTEVLGSIELQLNLASKEVGDKLHLLDYKIVRKPIYE